MPPKSLFRQPGAQHFQVVHRSQRDPLINDPEASQQVLKPVGRANARDKKAGTTLAELEAGLDKSRIRQNEGEAAGYGITYDDSAYDYMQHLKPIGVPGGEASFLIPAPRGSTVTSGMKAGIKGKGKAKAEELFSAIPEVLASDKEVTLQQVYAREQSIPVELQGLQPDMDPHLRQVLEALEDEAFEDADEEGWFDELVTGGEVQDGEEKEEYIFEEWGIDESDPSKSITREEDVPELVEVSDDAPWEERFKAFKHNQQVAGGPGSEVVGEERSEMADTIGSLPASMADMMVRGGKKRRGKRGPSDASGMSMSSSSVFRTQGLRDLDDRFDKIELDYDLDDLEEEDEFDDSLSMAPSQMSAFSSTSRASLFSSTSAKPPTVSRDDFDAILDDFLENFEVVGSKYRPALGNAQLSGPEKLKVLRMAIEEGEEGWGKEENRRRIMEIERLNRGPGSTAGKKAKGDGEIMERVKREEDEGEKWDVETVLKGRANLIATYTNTENHPAMIRSRTIAETKARAARQAALQNGDANGSHSSDDDEDSDDSGSETETETPKVTVARAKGESKEERKARKAGVKADRQARRVEKKTRQEAFGTERRKALASHRKLVGAGKAADVAPGGRGVISLS